MSLGFFSASLVGVFIGYNTNNPSGISSLLCVENQLLGNIESGNSGLYCLNSTTSISFALISSTKFLNSSLAFLVDVA